MSRNYVLHSSNISARAALWVVDTLAKWLAVNNWTLSARYSVRMHLVVRQIVDTPCNWNPEKLRGDGAPVSISLDPSDSGWRPSRANISHWQFRQLQLLKQCIKCPLHFPTQLGYVGVYNKQVQLKQCTCPCPGGSINLPTSRTSSYYQLPNTTCCFVVVKRLSYTMHFITAISSKCKKSVNQNSSSACLPGGNLDFVWVGLVAGIFR